MADDWTYNESTQVGTDYGDRREALEYDRGMEQLRNLAEEVGVAAEALRLSRQSTVWEIGTGTGEIAIGLAARCAKVWGTDISPAMLELAQKKAVERGCRNVEFGVGGFLKGFAPDQSVDAVISQLALHHLPDFWKMAALRRIAHALAPAGRLYLKDVVYPGGLDDYSAFFSKAIEGVRNSGGERMAQQTIEHIRAEYSTFDWVLEEMLRRAGLRMVGKEVQGFLTTYVCTK